MPSLELDPRVLGQRISEARKARGKTQEEVAEFLGYSRPTYIAIEKGERTAKPDEIIKLASFFGRKVNELVRPGEPVNDLQPHLRAVADKMKTGDQFQARLNAAIDQLQALAEDYLELERIMGAPHRPSYPAEVVLNLKLDPTEQAEVVANQERNRLGLGDQPVIDLRSTLEWDVGLRIFYTRDLPSSIAGMYAYSAELGACILINRNHPPERRRVSMLHEYGHFLLSTDRYKPGIDYLTMPGRKPANERFAEAFALSFLMGQDCGNASQRNRSMLAFGRRAKWQRRPGMVVQRRLRRQHRPYQRVLRRYRTEGGPGLHAARTRARRVEVIISCVDARG